MTESNRCRTINLFKPWFIPLIIIILWSVGSLTERINPFLLPPPWNVFNTAVMLVTEGILLNNVFVSLKRVFVGFAMSMAVGLPLGIMVGLHRTMRQVFEGPIDFVRCIPPLAMTPLLILWFGIGELPKLLIIVLASFFPIFLNAASGVSNADNKLIEVGKVLGLKPYHRICRIILPAALPSIIVGIRLGIGFSWRALIGAELLAAAAGLGYMIIEAEHFSRADIVIVGIVTIGILGRLIDMAFIQLTKLLTPWQQNNTNHVWN